MSKWTEEQNGILTRIIQHRDKSAAFKDRFQHLLGQLNYAHRVIELQNNMLGDLTKQKLITSSPASSIVPVGLNVLTTDTASAQNNSQPPSPLCLSSSSSSHSHEDDEERKEEEQQSPHHESAMADVDGAVKPSPATRSGVQISYCGHIHPDDDDLDTLFARAHMRQRAAMKSSDPTQTQCIDALTMAAAVLSTGLDGLVRSHKLSWYEGCEQGGTTIYGGGLVKQTEQNGQLHFEIKGNYSGVIRVERQDSTGRLNGQFDVLRYKNGQLCDVVMSAPFEKKSRVFDLVTKEFADKLTQSTHNIWARPDLGEDGKPQQSFVNQLGLSRRTGSSYLDGFQPRPASPDHYERMTDIPTSPSR